MGIRNQRQAIGQRFHVLYSGVVAIDAYGEQVVLVGFLLLRRDQRQVAVGNDLVDRLAFYPQEEYTRILVDELCRHLAEFGVRMMGSALDSPCRYVICDYFGYCCVSDAIALL